VGGGGTVKNGFKTRQVPCCNRQGSLEKKLKINSEDLRHLVAKQHVVRFSPIAKVSLEVSDPCFRSPVVWNCKLDIY
jgi:hypothetical protein